MRYKFIEDLTSDVMFEAYGKTVEELFVNASLALFEVVCQIKKIKPEKSINVKAEGEDLKDLLYNWLSNLLAQSEINELFFCKFDIKIKKNSKYTATGKALGEPITKEKGETVVKGITYYKFKLEKTKEGYIARIACDI